MHEQGGTEVTNKLSRREKEVAELISQGLSNKRIAATLYISEYTAKFHVCNVIQKLGGKGKTRTDVAVAWTIAKAFEKGYQKGLEEGRTATKASVPA